ncbi:hypothetical protein DFH06DRAFT_1325696 [Mycena polygramma]|nr:hypothetical protein DFH06DRAFT_1325696 [Mycena polygramma]
MALAFCALWLISFVVVFPSKAVSSGVSSNKILLSTRRDVYILKLPCELTTLILLLACGDLFHPEDTGHFDRTRMALLHTCRRWRAIVASCTSFWSRCYFRQYDSKSAVQFIVSHFRQAALDLRVIFEDYYVPHLHLKPKRLPTISSKDTINAIMPYLQNCRSLVLVLEDRRAFPAFMDALSRINELMVETFVLSRTIVIPRITQPFPNTVLFARLSRLRNLYLTRATIGWSPPQTFATLDTLVLDDLNPIYAPTQLQLGSLIEAAKGLRRFSMRDVTFPHVSRDDPPLPLFTSHSLREIDLHFIGDKAMAHFIRGLHLPAVHSLSVQINTVDDIFCVLHCTELLRSATTFTVSSYPIFGATLVRYPLHKLMLVDMFEHLHSVQTLDLTRAGPHFFPAMLTGNFQSHVCPTLQTLRVSRVEVQPIMDFLVARLPADADTPLPLTLDLHDLARCRGDGSDLELVKALLEPDRVRFDPEYEDKLGWISYRY